MGLEGLQSERFKVLGVASDRFERASERFL
jgi:hypothetical protein